MRTRIMNPGDPPANPLGPTRVPPPPPRPRGSSVLTIFFILSLLFNAVLVMAICGGLIVLLLGPSSSDSTTPLSEKHYSGSSSAAHKVAVIRLEGIIMEGALNFVHRQIETAAKDSDVAAVVLRINSPGGSITASDDLHHRLLELRDGNPTRGTTGKKHLIVSMGSIAASGGYYVAMPGSPLFAEKTTITGSIGVYAALPNIAGLADQHGVTMTVIKRGDVKASGSMFKPMSAEERAVWDDMVGHAYDQFLNVVETGRPNLKGKLTDPPVIQQQQKGIEQKLNQNKELVEEVVQFQYVRRLADGGIYTADQALKFGLIDKIGYLDDAIEEAKKAAGVSDVKVITYKEPFSFSELLSGKAPEPAAHLDAAALSAAAMPRLWYLAPGHELAGYLAATRR